jgi:hypothetical protein
MEKPKIRSTLKKTKAQVGKNNRRKGHNLERAVVNDLIEAGYLRAGTSRRWSRALDDAKVDIAHVPFNIQCKAVDSQNLHFDNYQALKQEIEEAIEEIVPERKNLPTIIIHKRNGKTLVVMDYASFLNIVKIK